MKLRLVTVLALALSLFLIAIGGAGYAHYLATPTVSDTISLTDSGFTPTDVTVATGTTIIWQNNTTQTYTLAGETTASTDYFIYLPVIFNGDGTSSSSNSLVANTTFQATETFSGTLPPGGTFSYQFTTAGTYDFYISEQPDLKGQVTVKSPLLVAWLLNIDEASIFIKEDDNSDILVNVQSVAETTISSTTYARVNASGIPNYAHTMTITDINTLNNRPKAGTDFNGGQTSAMAGQVVEFGQDIGYDNSNCSLGYWPQGPTCPGNVAHEVNFPLTQQENTVECETGLDTIGLWVNGASIFNWGDGFYYDPNTGSGDANNGIWQNLAPALEKYDVDICGGHAAVDTYHHHGYSTCLAEQLGDDGSEHSPIYGFAADGYPVYGPWHDNGVLVQSCWMTRTYTAASPTGCGVDNQRNCILVDQYDISQGTTPIMPNQFGPSITGTVTSLSGNVFDAESGIFFQDYYYDSNCTAQGPQYLDEHNGHDHDGLGYHYHLTVEESADGTLSSVFPYIIGPTFYGELQDNAIATCKVNPGSSSPITTGQVGHAHFPEDHEH